MTNLARLLEESAAAHPDRTLIVQDDAVLSYQDVDSAASQVARLLVDHGVRPGDKVALSCPNRPEFTSVYFGILKAGACVVPLNVLLKKREIEYHLRDSDAKAYFAFEGDAGLPIRAAAEEAWAEVPACTSYFSLPADPDVKPPWAAYEPAFKAVEVDDDETAVILYTSGTTGRPKGAELRHRNLRDNALVNRQLFAIDPERPDTFLSGLPLYHTFGQTCIQNTAIAFGGRMVVLPRFDARTAIDLMRRHGVTLFAGVPTMYWNLLRAAEESDDERGLGPALRLAVSGGAPLPAEIHQRFRKRFGVTVLEGYGLTEGSPSVTFAIHGQEPRVGSIGVPIPGVEMKLVDDEWREVPDGDDQVGEIAFRGHNVMKGYHGRPDATAAVLKDGWLRTGDLARRDRDGYYYIVDRSKNMIIRGGYNVYPREVEEVLITHPAVSLAAVVGVPHESHGEEIKAVVVRRPGHEHVTGQEIVDWMRERVAAYKYPRIVEFRSELPMTATGKILKREL